MIDFPAEITNDTFNTLFSRGMVIRTKVVLHDGSEDYKRLIVVSLDCTVDDTYHMICTSKTAFFTNNPFVKEDCHFIEPGQTTIFDRQAVIDLRKIFSLQKVELVQRYSRNNLDFLGALRDDIMLLVDGKLRRSRLLSPKQKTSIVTL
ncbi:MAG TPA: hypothetical protein VGK02_11990 [Candidatus Aquicultor sp.]|jgi:hypothetical protein